MRNQAQTPFFELGTRFDAVVYDGTMPLLSRQDSSALLSTIVYTADQSAVLGTIVNGRWIVKHGIHIMREAIVNRYHMAMRTMTP